MTSGSFRLEYECETEYEYDIQISNQSRSHSPGFSLLLISRDGGSRNNIDVLCDVQFALSLKSRTGTQSHSLTPVAVALQSQFKSTALQIYKTVNSHLIIPVFC